MYADHLVHNQQYLQNDWISHCHIYYRYRVTITVDGCLPRVHVTILYRYNDYRTMKYTSTLINRKMRNTYLIRPSSCVSHPFIFPCYSSLSLPSSHARSHNILVINMESHKQKIPISPDKIRNRNFPKCSPFFV